MWVVDRGLVYDAGRQPMSRWIAFFDSLIQLSSGDWLCGFTVGKQKHDPNGTLALYRSGPEGNRWEPMPWSFDVTWRGVSGSLTGAELVEAGPGQLLLLTTWFDRSDPDRPLFDPITEGLLHSSLLLAESSDAGETWSGWREISTPGLQGCSVTGPAIQWQDRTMAVAFESFKHFDDPQPARHAAWLVVSTDRGASFGPPQLVARDPQDEVYYWDQRITLGDRPGEYVGPFLDARSRGAARSHRAPPAQSRIGRWYDCDACPYVDSGANCRTAGLA